MIDTRSQNNQQPQQISIRGTYNDDDELIDEDDPFDHLDIHEE